ncbi:hypothetical protein FACS1894139_12230 [Planctomycetales bacterium]|nr:hypothetical protein FACS1894139_12230 [Planctomycetales bacterium]
MVGDNHVDARLLHLRDAVVFADAAVNGNDQRRAGGAGFFDKRGRDAVALGGAMRQIRRYVGVERAQHRYHNGGGGNAVGVVVAVNNNFFFIADGARQAFGG